MFNFEKDDYIIIKKRASQVTKEDFFSAEVVIRQSKTVLQILKSRESDESVQDLIFKRHF